MGFEPRIVGFLCNWCSYTGADLAGTSRIQYAPSIRVIRVMCSARIDPTFVLKASRRGPTGCSSAAAIPAIATTRRGTTRRCGAWRCWRGCSGLRDRAERVRLEWVSASEGQRFADIVDDMTRKLRELGPSRVRPALEADRAER